MKCPINKKHSSLITVVNKHNKVPYCKECGREKSDKIQDILIENLWNEHRVERIYESRKARL